MKNLLAVYTRKATDEKIEEKKIAILQADGTWIGDSATIGLMIEEAEYWECDLSTTSGRRRLKAAISGAYMSLADDDPEMELTEY